MKNFFSLKKSTEVIRYLTENEMLASTLPDFLVFLIFFLKFGRSLIFAPRSLFSSEQYSGSTHCIDKNFPIPIIIGLPTRFLSKIEDVVLTEVPKLMVNASELVLTPI